MISVDTNKFVDYIMTEVGEIPVTNCQKYRVLVVRDSKTHEPMVSAQRWWRKDVSSSWVAGKGFKLDSSESQQLASLLLDAVNKLSEYK